MLNRNLVVATVVLAAGACIGLVMAQPEKAVKPATISKPAAAQPEKPKGQPGDAKHEMGGEAPGPQHAALMKLAGTWTTSMSMVGGPPGSETPTAGTSKFAAELGGRFLSETSEGMMGPSKMSSSKMMGYNTDTGKYEGSWQYTMSNSMLFLSGTSKDGGKTIVCDGWVNGKGGKKEEMTITYTFTDNDHFSIVMEGKGPEGQGHSFTTAYTRKK